MKKTGVLLLTIMLFLVSVLPLSAADAEQGLTAGITHYWSFDPVDKTGGGGRVKNIPADCGDISLTWIWPGKWRGGEWLSKGVTGKAIVIAHKVRLQSGTTDSFLTQNFTIAGWINLNATTKAIKKRGIFMGDKWTVELYDQKLRLTANGKTVLKSKAKMPEKKWLHVAAIVSKKGGSTTGKLYINGQKVASGKLSESVLSKNKPYKQVKIGSNLDGLVDEMAIWDRAFAADDISVLCSLGKEGKALSSTVKDRPTVSLRAEKSSNNKYWGAFVLNRDTTKGDLRIQLNYGGKGSGNKQFPEYQIIPDGAREVRIPVQRLKGSSKGSKDFVSATIKNGFHYKVKQSDLTPRVWLSSDWPKPHPVRSKKIFAHYMGCNPVGTASLNYHKHRQDKTVRHTSPKKDEQRGGHVRNWDLITYDQPKLSLEESAEIEIKRAMRIGIDGFAIDAWAGGRDAKATLEALFKVAEKNDYPFELTICLDPNVGGRIVGTVKYMIEKYGNSPKLARRDGKPLIFGYYSLGHGKAHLRKKFPGKTKKEYRKLESTPEGWDAMWQVFDWATKEIGQPVYWYGCMSFVNPGPSSSRDKTWPLAAAAMAKHVNAVGKFGGSWGSYQPDIARAVRDAGAEWGGPLGMFQKENIPYEVRVSTGLNQMDSGWQDVRDQNSTLLQLITWNDYGENTPLAPAYNTRYSLYDLTGFYVKWWKTGKQPQPERDKIYLIYRKYAKGAKVFPFKQGPYGKGVFEVVTLLTKKAQVRLPGRNISYEAPAGFYRRQFAVTPGLVSAKLYRGNKQVLKIESPEPITDKPFREDNSMVCYSSEYERLWKEDFGDTPVYTWSEYGDIDGDGLPNWFEMYWFGKFGDLKTATKADPKTIAPNGKTLLECYQQQLDPTKK